MPKISIICLNSTETTVESILAQPFSDIEVLLMQMQYKGIDKRIYFNKIPEGQYIFFAEGNINVKFNMFSTMIEIMEKYNAEIGICGVNSCGEKIALPLMCLNTIPQKFFAMKKLIKKDIFMQPCVTIMKNVFKEPNIDEFFKNFKELYLNANVYVFSNDFIEIKDNLSKKDNIDYIDYIDEMFEYFFTKGEMNNA